MVSQRGNAMPAPVVVTSPPIQIRGNVAQTSSTARRCGQGESAMGKAFFNASQRLGVERNSFRSAFMPSQTWKLSSIPSNGMNSVLLVCVRQPRLLGHALGRRLDLRVKVVGH